MVAVLFVGNDEPVAKELMKLLEGAGHAVHRAAPDDFRSRSYEHAATVVLWSDAALASPEVYEVARIALTRGNLVQVLVSGFDVSSLPAVFGVWAPVPIADTEQILRAVRALVLRKDREAAAGGQTLTREIAPRFTPGTAEAMSVAPPQPTFRAPPQPSFRQAPKGPQEEKQAPGERGFEEEIEEEEEADDSAREFEESANEEHRRREEEDSAEEHSAPTRGEIEEEEAPRFTPGTAEAMSVAPPQPTFRDDPEALVRHQGDPSSWSPPQIPPNWKAALEKEAGQLVHRVPEKMRVGAPEVIEVRMGRAHRDMTVGIMGTGDVSMEELPIVETMTVNLYGSAGAFEIVRQSRETQLVKSSLIWNTAFDQQKFGRWLWHVTPKTAGTYELIVAVSADLSDSRGVSTSEPYRDRMFPISVRVNYGRASARVLKWTVAGAVTGLAGAFTHDVWWPKLKVWLTGAGLLG